MDRAAPCFAIGFMKQKLRCVYMDRILFGYLHACCWLFYDLIHTPDKISIYTQRCLGERAVNFFPTSLFLLIEFEPSPLSAFWSGWPYRTRDKLYSCV